MRTSGSLPRSMAQLLRRDTSVTDDDLASFVRGLCYAVETAHDTNGFPYTVIRDVTIPTGGLAGRVGDVVVAHCQSVPYVVAPAIDTPQPFIPVRRSFRWT
jgi:hypothetical protein